MKNNFRPFSVTLLCAIVGLGLAMFLYKGGGGSALITGLSVLYVAGAIYVGITWPVYPWQIGLVSSVPSWIFLVWRSIISQDPADLTLNITLFFFLPLISFFSTYVGVYIGRRIAIRKKKKAASHD